MQGWKLERTVQCDDCPWRVGTNPRNIPDEYDEEKHKALKGSTIADPTNPSLEYSVMACHKHPQGQEAHCIGWLNHQLNEGNNLGLRVDMLFCDNAEDIRIKGPQHPDFESTLPK